MPGIGTLELQRKHAHAHQIAAVNTLETAGNHRANSQQLRSLGSPVATRPGAVLLARKNDGIGALRQIQHGGVVDRHFLDWGVTGRAKQRHAAFLAGTIDARRDHEVLDAHVGKSASHHHLVVAAARAIAIEVRLHHPVTDQPLPRGRALTDRARRGNMVGGDGVAEQRHDACANHPFFAQHRRRLASLSRNSGLLQREIRKKRWLCNVCTLRPGIGIARHALNLFPQFAGLGFHARVIVPIGLSVHCELQQLMNLVAAGPNVSEVNVFDLAIGTHALTHRFGHQVAQHGTGNRVRNNQRRTCKEVGLQVGVNARLEIAVTRQHGSANQIVGSNNCIEFWSEVARIADAGRTAIAH